MKAKKFNKSFDQLILPFFILVLFLFSLSSIYNLTLNLEDMVRIEGKVGAIRIKEENGLRGRKNYNLYVYLQSGYKYKIMDDDLFENCRNRIQENVEFGDSITIFTRTQRQTNFGSGTKDLIYQLEHEGQILMPLEIMQTNFRGLLIFELLILSGLTTFQIYRVKKRTKKN